MAQADSSTSPDSVNICVNGGFFTDIIAHLDFQKETISHQSLLKKLSNPGIRGKEQAWVRMPRVGRRSGVHSHSLQWEVTGEFHRNAGVHVVPKWTGKRSTQWLENVCTSYEIAALMKIGRTNAKYRELQKEFT